MKDIGMGDSMLVLTMGSRKLEIDSVLLFKDRAIINSGSTKLICEDMDKIRRMFEVLDIEEDA